MRGLVLASILLTASSLAASTINANFFAVAFSEVDAASNNSQFFLNLNQVSASSGSNFSGGLSPLYPVTGELSEVSSSSASLIGGMLHSRAATSLQANPIIYDGGGAISQAFIGDTLTVTGPVLHQNLRLTFQINGSSFFYGGNSQYLQSLATLDVYVYAPLTWNTELTSFILHQSVPLSSGGRGKSPCR